MIFILVDRNKYKHEKKENHFKMLIKFSNTGRENDKEEETQNYESSSFPINYKF